MISGPIKTWQMCQHSPRAKTFLKLMFDVSVDMIIYIIVAFVVVVLDVLSIMDGKNFSNLKLNKKTSI